MYVFNIATYCMSSNLQQVRTSLCLMPDGFVSGFLSQHAAECSPAHFNGENSALKLGGRSRCDIKRAIIKCQCQGGVYPGTRLLQLWSVNSKKKKKIAFTGCNFVSFTLGVCFGLILPQSRSREAVFFCCLCQNVSYVPSHTSEPVAGLVTTCSH